MATISVSRRQQPATIPCPARGTTLSPRAVVPSAIQVAPSIIANNKNGYTVINPTAGNLARITGVSSAGEACCDYVRVYNGNGTGGTLLGQYQMGTAIPQLTSTTGPLTVQFVSDGSVTGAGFSATISCIAAPLPGENCTNAQNLALLTSPYSATTVGYTEDISICRTGVPGPHLLHQRTERVAVDHRRKHQQL